ncbi:MAG: hypothetical protein SGARI_003075 [Bacillariaceae sp.]
MRLLAHLVDGGAWIIGYKMWGTLLARTLVPFGIMVVIPDYRNFPQTNIEGMIQDADRAVEWTLRNIQKHGGDPNKVVICGQSAGAHIGANLLLQKAQKKQVDDNSSNKSEETSTMPTAWHATDTKGFIAVSGPYDLVSMEPILHEKGLDKSIVGILFDNNLEKYSPTRTIQLLNPTTKQQVQQHFPPTCTIHGQVDKTVPFQISLELFRAMKELNLQQPVEFKLYPSWSHTDPILEAPFAGNHLFHRDVYDLVQLWTKDDNKAEGEVKDTESLLLPFDENHSACATICPLPLVKIARICNPF